MRTEEWKEHVGVGRVIKAHSQIATTLISVLYKRARVPLATTTSPHALPQGWGWPLSTKHWWDPLLYLYTDSSLGETLLLLAQRQPFLVIHATNGKAQVESSQITQT